MSLFCKVVQILLALLHLYSTAPAVVTGLSKINHFLERLQIRLMLNGENTSWEFQSCS